jgi:hypothetical protein
VFSKKDISSIVSSTVLLPAGGEWKANQTCPAPVSGVGLVAAAKLLSHRPTETLAKPGAAQSRGGLTDPVVRDHQPAFAALARQTYSNRPRLIIRKGVLEGVRDQLVDNQPLNDGAILYHRGGGTVYQCSSRE